MGRCNCRFDTESLNFLTEARRREFRQRGLSLCPPATLAQLHRVPDDQIRRVCLGLVPTANGMALRLALFEINGRRLSTQLEKSAPE